MYGDLVRVGRNIHHGDLETFLNLLGGGHAVHVALQVDVHQNQIRAQLLGQPDSLLSPRRDPDDRMAQVDQAMFNVHRDNGFIFDHEDAHIGHGREPPSAGELGVKVIVNMVPVV